VSESEIDTRPWRSKSQPSLVMERVFGARRRGVFVCQSKRERGGGARTGEKEFLCHQDKSAHPHCVIDWLLFLLPPVVCSATQLAWRNHTTWMCARVGYRQGLVVVEPKTVYFSSHTVKERKNMQTMPPT
jgi:hypothetical protein